MNNEKAYLQFIKGDVNLLKASEIQDLVEQESKVVVGTLLVILTTLPFLISLLYMLFWFSKVSLFVTIIFGLFVVLPVVMTINSVNFYKLKIKKVNDRLEKL